MLSKKELVVGGGRALQAGYEQFRMGQPDEELAHRIITESEEEDTKGNNISKQITRLAENEDRPEHLRDMPCDLWGLQGGGCTKAS